MKLLILTLLTIITSVYPQTVNGIFIINQFSNKQK